MNRNGKLNSGRLKTPAHSSMAGHRTSSVGTRLGVPNRQVTPGPVIVNSLNGKVDKTEAKFPDTKFPPKVPLAPVPFLKKK